MLRAARCEGERAEGLQASFAHLRDFQTRAQRRGSKPAVIIASVVELGLVAGGRYRTMWEAQQQAKDWHLGLVDEPGD